jgi:hypothetical protein
MGLTQKQRDMKAARAAARAATLTAEPPAEERCVQTNSSDRRAIIETAATLAYTLGEETYHARLELLQSVRALGPDVARALLAEALRIDAEGGELVMSRSRYRTPGGIYFRLVRDRLEAPAPHATLLVGVLGPIKP